MQAIDEAGSGRFGFATCHIDELSDVEAFMSIERLASMLANAERLLQHAGASGSVRLALPLPPSARLLTRPPARRPRVRWSKEPPSLYYMEPRFWLNASDREEYRVPLSGRELTDLGLLGEYSCGRSLYERERSWEYTRTFWLRLDPARRSNPEAAR